MFPRITKLLLTVLLTSPLAAQQTPHVTVALVDRLADSAVATIIHSPGPDGRMLVLLRARDADAITLSSAMMAVFEVRRVLGDTARSRVSLNVYGTRVPESIAPNERTLAEDYLGRLRVTKPAPLEGVGVVRSVEVTLPPPAPFKARGSL